MDKNSKPKTPASLQEQLEDLAKSMYGINNHFSDFIKLKAGVQKLEEQQRLQTDAINKITETLNALVNQDNKLNKNAREAFQQFQQLVENISNKQNEIAASFRGFSAGVGNYLNQGRAREQSGFLSRIKSLANLLLPWLLIGLMAVNLVTVYFVNRSISRLRAEVRQIKLRQTSVDNQNSGQPNAEALKRNSKSRLFLQERVL